MMVKWLGISNSLGLSVLLVTLINVFELNAIVPSPNPSLVVVASPSPHFAGTRRVPKQVGTVGGAIMNGNKDQQQAAGYHHDHHHGLHGMDMGHHGDGKYFQYAHNPSYGEYEFGYRRGNDYHFQERYEKYGPGWSFKTKVKWGDKKAGYGEHYWDYNHGDSHGHDDGHSGGGGGDDGHYSEPVPAYETQATGKNKPLTKRENRGKMLQRQGKRNNGHKHEDNLQASATSIPTTVTANRSYGARSQIPRPLSNSEPSSLLLDTKSGKIIDESTGKAYWLKPENSY